MINFDEIRVKIKNRSHRYDIIDLYQGIVANILNIINVSQYYDGYV